MDPTPIEHGLSRAPSDQIRTYAESFLRDGYVIIPNSIPVEQCDATLIAFRRLEASNAELFKPHLDLDRHYPRIVNLHLVLPELRQLFSQSVMALAVQDFLFGAETVLYTSLFYERGSAQDLHRDTPYFCTRPEYRYFGMWVALEDVDEDNGPLIVMQGGHKMPELDREALAAELFGSAEAAPAQSDELWVAYQNRVASAGRDQGLAVRTMPVKKGSTIIWHPQLPHGGAPIRDLNRTRFSLVMHTTPMNTPVYHQDAFFNPSRPYPTVPSWSYARENGRRFARHSTVSFNHQTNHAVEEFRQPAPKEPIADRANDLQPPWWRRAMEWIGR